MRARFWETVPLAAMTDEEWEALCDGCGRCCLMKLEDIETGELRYTNVTCRLFDAETRRCGHYECRHQIVSDCVNLTPANIAETAKWMPASCAYRRLHEGRGLADWHPLISGRPETVAEAGISVAEPLFPEYEVPEEELEDHFLEQDLIAEDG